MSDTKILRVLERVDRALLAEIEVLQDGRFQELRELQVETAAAMRGLDALQAQRDLPVVDKARINAAVVKVARHAERAQGFLASALHGARNARARIETLIQSEGQIGTYDRSGAPVAMKSVGSPYNKVL